jgi:hypothetical protein
VRPGRRMRTLAYGLAAPGRSWQLLKGHITTCLQAGLPLWRTLRLL